MAVRAPQISRTMRHLSVLPGVAALRAKKLPFRRLTERELIQRESEIGRQLFGPIQKGGRREFFNTDPRIWIWHEEWTDVHGMAHQLTTKYEIRDDGVWKVQPGPRYIQVVGDELANFQRAVTTYYERTMREVYQRHPYTGEKLL